MKSKKIIALMVGAVLLLMAAWSLGVFRNHATNDSNSSPASTTQNINQSGNQTLDQIPGINLSASPVSYPISDWLSRITKKKFGQYITPQTSPVQPERFTGYHTAAD